jgi:iron complex transport system ATP-binding protein
VEAIIGEVETPENILQNVIPLSISTSAEPEPELRNRRSIATITIIANNNQMADQINALLHEYGNLMIGRMGMPYREFGLYLINITLDGNRETILELSHRLNVLPDISVKTTFAKGNFDLQPTKEV